MLLNSLKPENYEEMTMLLKWSVAVNDTIAGMVHGIPPFPGVTDVLANFSRYPLMEYAIEVRMSIDAEQDQKEIRRQYASKLLVRMKLLEDLVKSKNIKYVPSAHLHLDKVEQI